MADAVAKRVGDYQRELFAALDVFFRRVTNTAAEDFEGFKDLSEKTWPEFATRFNSAMDPLLSELERLYNKHRHQQFTDARLLGGVKLVLGGGSRFYATQSEAVRRTTLYADTILIPDPVYAWTEADRRDDAFSPAIELFKTIHALLELRPLIDADVETLPIVLFPSFEKELEQHDPTTQAAMKDLTAAYFNAGLGTSYAAVEEVFQHAADNDKSFIAAVHRAGLFVPRGHNSPSEDIMDAIRKYREDMIERRGPAQVELAKSLGDGEVLALAIFESVAPQFHLFENSVSLAAQPLMCFPNHWHYYRTLAGGIHRELAKSGLVSNKTASTIEALQQERFGWMGELAISDLVGLRQSSGFADFRRTLDSYTAALDDVQLRDIDRVGGEVAAGIASLLDKHDDQMRKIVAEYAAKHTKSAIAAGGGFAVAFLPALGSVISGLGAFTVLTRFVFDKIDERKAKRDLSRSLIGVLARANVKK